MTTPQHFLKSRVAALPEIYQPIYDHPDLSISFSRDCEERFAAIAEFYGALVSFLGRPARILDLGCAQGWFSLRLADKGARVVGIDWNESNIAVCEALAAEHPKKRVSFEVGNIEDLADRIQEGAFDLVLGLSVFHHLCHEKGMDFVRGLIEKYLAKIPFALIEFARADEPPAWAKSLPETPAYFLENIPFRHILSWHATHLSALPRPLYCASRRYWYLGGEIEAFTEWTAISQPLVGNQDNGRRYFFSEKKVAKLYQKMAANAEAISAEANFLSRAPGGYHWAPHIFASGESPTESWLVRERLPGSRLIDFILQNKPYDGHAIILQILRQLAVLEKAGLFHHDLRSWNILLDEEGGQARLIDYDSIGPAREDCAWPNDPFLAFWIFVHEVLTREVKSDRPARQPFISPYNLPERYARWAHALWNLPPRQWTFAFLLETLENPVSVEEDMTAAAAWRQAIERHLDLALDMFSAIETRLAQLESPKPPGNFSPDNAADAMAPQQAPRQLPLQARRKTEADLRMENSLLSAQNQELRHETRNLARYNADLLASHSWRLTAPLRLASRLLRALLPGARSEEAQCRGARACEDR